MPPLPDDAVDAGEGGGLSPAAIDLPDGAGLIEAQTSAQILVPAVVDAFAPRSILDVGCGVGSWLAEFQASGVEDVMGVDAAYVVDHLAVDRSRFVVSDITSPLDLGRTFDLVVSVEVGEHLPKEAAATYVASLARHGDLVLFSAASWGQPGPGHVNLQWPAYWCDLFREHGLYASDPFRRRFWNDERVAYWYRQNLLVFGTPAALARVGLPAEDPLPLVHPELMMIHARRADVFRREVAALKEAQPAPSPPARDD